MITIPLAVIIERHDKEVASFQCFQSCITVLLAGDGIAERTMQLIEHRGLEQEVPDTIGLTLQNLFDQIVHDLAVVAGEGPDEAGNILVALHGKRG